MISIFLFAMILSVENVAATIAQLREFFLIMKIEKNLKKMIISVMS